MSINEIEPSYNAQPFRAIALYIESLDYMPVYLDINKEENWNISLFYQIELINRDKCYRRKMNKFLFDINKKAIHIGICRFLSTYSIDEIINERSLAKARSLRNEYMNKTFHRNVINEIENTVAEYCINWDILIYYENI
jgi:hypothetical protein